MQLVSNRAKIFGRQQRLRDVNLLCGDCLVGRITRRVVEFVRGQPVFNISNIIQYAAAEFQKWRTVSSKARFVKPAG